MVASGTMLFVLHNGTSRQVEQCRRRLRRRDFVEMHDPIEGVWIRTANDVYLVINTRASWSLITNKLLGDEWRDEELSRIPDLIEQAITYRYFRTPTRPRK